MCKNISDVSVYLKHLACCLKFDFMSGFGVKELGNTTAHLLHASNLTKNIVHL